MNLEQKHFAIIEIAVIFIGISVICGVLYLTRPNTQIQSIPSALEPQPQIQWLGYATHAIPNPTPDTENPIIIRAEPRIQIGLRNDGTVIWRLLKQEAETEQVEEGPELK